MLLLWLRLQRSCRQQLWILLLPLPWLQQLALLLGKLRWLLCLLVSMAW